MKKGEGNFAHVAIPSPLKEPLIYKVPPSLSGRIGIGMRVLIPLGKRQVTGVVVELLPESSLEQVKEILALLDDRPILDPGLLKLAQWTSRYYLATMGEVFAAILPPSLRTESQRVVVAGASEVLVRGALERKIILELENRKGKITLKTLARMIPQSRLYRALERLENVGAIEIREQPPPKRRKKILASPEFASVACEASAKLDLTREQQQALGSIEERMETGGYETFLLHGVTGSGKTEVYLRAMERARRSGRRSLILIPEISLTPQLLDQLRERFPGRVGVLHSGLTPSERWAQWWQSLRGEVDIVVGARSAVFAPLPDLGLIVVDEEHDPSYKQEDGLRYNGRDLAIVRARLSGCPVLLGSATPALESYENSLQGRYRLLRMPFRVRERPLPRLDIVDLRSDFKRSVPERNLAQQSSPENSAGASLGSEYRLISHTLAEALRNNYQNSRQSLIFLNRRGFANFLQCRACGFVLRCSHCSVTLTFHLKQNSATCHHCNFRKAATDLCPDCGQPTLMGVGAGTEQIERELGRLVPQARIARMDRDTTGKRGSHEELIRKWAKGEIDILVGTQMITKGHDVAGVTLVGALLADLSLNLPDFRAAERTFQLLGQVAGRSGRGPDPGQVIIQTYTPDHYAIKHLIDHDYQTFIAAEKEFRRALNYPPFSRLVNLRLDGPRFADVESKAKSIATNLRAQQKLDEQQSQELEILGPAPAPIQKLRNRYRWQILLKGKKSSVLLEFARQARELIPRSSGTRLHIDVDPYNML